MKIFVFAGPNGSGKTTIVRDFFKDARNHNIPFLNADEMAKNYYGYVKDENEKNRLAAELAENKRFECVETGTSFAYETVLSTDRHITFLKRAKQEKQAFVSTFYIMTKSADINVERVCHRVSTGGHDVPEEKIRTRYARCMDLMPEIIEVSDFFALFDNSVHYDIITFKAEGVTYLIIGNETYPLPEGVKKMNLQVTTFDKLKTMSIKEEIQGFSNMLETCGKERL